MPGRIVRALALLCVLAIASCSTEPATDVGYFDATVHTKVGCLDTRGPFPGYDAQWRIAYRLTTEIEWTPAAWHNYACPDEQPPYYLEGSPFAEQLTGLRHGRSYEYRLEVQEASGELFEWRDADGTRNGTNYHSFTTDTYPKRSAKSVDLLRNNIGINTRLAYIGTPYGADRCAENKAALAYLGIRFIRDGKWPAWETRQTACFKELQAMGVKATMGLGGLDFDRDGQCDAPNHALYDRLTEIRADPQIRAFVDRIESVNEPDLFSPFPGWPDCLRDYQQALYEAVDGEWPVVGPSFATSGKQAFHGGELGPFMDLCAIHNYPGDAPPGQSYDGDKPSCDKIAPGKPIAPTEVGYHNEIMGEDHTGPNGPDGIGDGVYNLGVNPTVHASYTLRMALEHYRRGATRTDFFTIVELTCGDANDGQGMQEADWGWYDCNWQPKPVAHAMHNFTATLGEGPLYPQPLAVTVDSYPVDTRPMVTLQRADGKYVLVLYRGVSLWKQKAPLTVAPADYKLTLPDAQTVHVVRPVDSAEPTPLSLAGNQITVPVAGDPVMLVVETD